MYDDAREKFLKNGEYLWCNNYNQFWHRHLVVSGPIMVSFTIKSILVTVTGKVERKKIDLLATNTKYNIHSLHYNLLFLQIYLNFQCITGIHVFLFKFQTLSIFIPNLVRFNRLKLLIFIAMHKVQGIAFDFLKETDEMM